MKITVRAKDQYGSTVYHPVCAAAKTFAAIAGTKTLTREVLIRIDELGYVIEVQNPIPHPITTPELHSAA